MTEPVVKVTGLDAQEDVNPMFKGGVGRYDLDWGSPGGQLMTARLAQDMLNQARASLLFTRFASPPRPPPTRMQRIRHRLDDYKERLSLAWAALRGEDLRREDD